MGALEAMHEESLALEGQGFGQISKRPSGVGQRVGLV